jgi:hypothetical protein
MPACRTTNGKFIRCPGAKAPKRRHRRRRKDWTGCGCPSGAKMVVSQSKQKGGRGWNCMKPTKKGPRFVKAVCADGK